MTPVPVRRTFIAKALAVVCMALVFGMGTAQAVHSHPADSPAPHHSCSLCSAPSLGPAATTVEISPLVRAVPLAYSARETSVIFRPVLTNFVRPPPAV